MQSPKANSFSQDIVLSKIMGPNPLKLCEEMLITTNEIVGTETVSSSSVVLDLGSGTGVTTALWLENSDAWLMPLTSGAARPTTCVFRKSWIDQSANCSC